MPRLRGKVDRQQLPSGRDGQVLVLDTHSPQGIAWRSGIDRLVTDITPELSGDLDCNSFALTEVGSVSLSDGSVTGVDTIAFTDTAGTIAGVQNQNLVDKSAAETIAGAWTFGSDIAMGTRKVTGLGAPSAGTDAANKTYADGVVLPDAHFCASKALESGATTVNVGGVTWATKPATWTENLASGWEEDGGNTGDFEYTGSATRKFLVTWSMTLDYLTAGTVYAQRTSITGKIEKTPSGGVAADVAGSIHQAGGMIQYATAWGSYFWLNHLSGSVIVSMATDDKLSFRYGFANSYSAVTATFTATLYGPGTAYHLGANKGVTINIIPVDSAS